MVHKIYWHFFATSEISIVTIVTIGDRNHDKNIAEHESEMT